jgi:hypothetical protein
VGYFILVFLFLFAGWFGSRLISTGLAGLRERSLEVGFGYRLRGRPAVGVSAVLLLAGVVVIAPFAWGIARWLISIIGQDRS